MGGKDFIAGFECSGNRRPLQGLSGNGRWTGLPLRAVLDRAGVKPSAREFVFFGADHGPEDVDFRGTIFKVEQQFGRSLTREQALSEKPFLAYALNGEPLTKHQGAPLRLLVPGWYGVANVKWLSQIHIQEDAISRQVSGAMVPHAEGRNDRRRDEMDRNGRHAHAPEVVHCARNPQRRRYQVLGVVLHDGTPLKSVEVRVDDGPWQPATMDQSTRAKYSWKLFTYAWSGATSGEHTLVSRVTDVNGNVQPTAEELAEKKTFLEDNSQHPRKAHDLAGGRARRFGVPFSIACMTVSSAMSVSGVPFCTRYVASRSRRTCRGVYRSSIEGARGPGW